MIEEEKIFSAVASCCSKNCYLKVSPERQEVLFKIFYNGNYEAGNVLLFSMIEKKENSGAEEYQRTQWNFFCRDKGVSTNVCKVFIANLFQVDDSRIKTVQEKISKGSSLADGRGKHGNQKVKLTDDIKTLIHSHCESLPHHQAHYSLEKTQLNYFNDSSITLKGLYESFLDYYTAITGNKSVPISDTVYFTYFNENINFTFGTPRTDVCNLCYIYEKNKNKKEEYDEHKVLVEDYKKMKKEMMSNKSALVCEFDFGQNLALPILPVNEQFFLRLLWLYIFNVHVFTTNNSYMFYCLEGNMKKGGNAVCNFVEFVLEKELKDNYYNKVLLFSDAAGGQNRNYNTLQFFSLLSVKYQLEIQHLFPVRGHSYCQCDRNFGLYGKKKKSKEYIETVEEYADLIKNSRNPPFEMIDVLKLDIKDYDNLFTISTEQQNFIQISKVKKIIYHPNGEIDLFYSYKGPHKTIRLNSIESLENIDAVTSAKKLGISKEKFADYEKLVPYCTPNGQKFAKETLTSTFIKEKSQKEKKGMVKKEKKEKKEPVKKEKKEKNESKKKKEKVLKLKVDNLKSKKNLSTSRRRHQQNEHFN